jgi:hypothetical protein
MTEITTTYTIAKQAKSRGDRAELLISNFETTFQG